jgi:hypothetical protein
VNLTFDRASDAGAIRLEVEFAVVEPGLPASQLARLILDLQELVITAHALARADAITADDPAIDPGTHLYKRMVEVQPGTLGEAEAIVELISQASPLQLGLLIRIGERLRRPLVAALHLLAERVLYSDLERERRQIDNQIHRQELISKVLDNIERAAQIQRRVRDPRVQELLRDSLRSTVTPFLVEHPPITRATVEGRSET